MKKHADVKKAVSIIITIIVILGMVAGYMFRGAAPVPPPPITVDANTQAPPPPTFKGPTGAPSVQGPTGAPSVQGPTAPIPQPY